MRRPKKSDALASKPMRKGLPFSGLSFQTGADGLAILCNRDNLPFAYNAIGYFYDKAVGAAFDFAKCNLEGVSWAHRLEEFGTSEPLAWSLKSGGDVVENANTGQYRMVREMSIKCRVIY